MGGFPMISVCGSSSKIGSKQRRQAAIMILNLGKIPLEKLPVKANLSNTLTLLVGKYALIVRARETDFQKVQHARFD